MTQKLLKHELVERLLQLKEKQDLLTVQMQLLAQEISELADPFMLKTPKSQSVITTRLIAQVLKENQGTWLVCGDIAERALRLVGQPQFVDVGDNHYKAVKRMLLRLEKKGLVERAGFHWRLKTLKTNYATRSTTSLLSQCFNALRRETVYRS